MSEERQRPRLKLQPRNESAAKEEEVKRTSGAKANPFGAAKPREAVLAVRSGKTEAEILEEEAKSQKINLRLNQEQRQEKEKAEEAIEDLKEQISLAEGDEAKAELQTQIDTQQTALDDLMENMAKATLEKAAKGEIERPSERRAAQMQQGMGGGGGGQQAADFTNFQQGGGRAPAGAYGGGAPAGGYGGGGGGGYQQGGGGGGGYQQGGGGGGGSRGGNDYGFATGTFNPDAGKAPGGYQNSGYQSQSQDRY